MEKYMLYLLLLVGINLTSCNSNKSEGLTREVIEKYKDKTALIHGPYTLIKLPIEKGVTIRNPVKILQGPDDFLYVANKSGEIYKLIDSDDDGLEDYAQLYCDVKTDGLRSPVSMLFRGDDLYVGTAQAIRVYSDINGDGVADTSRVFFDKIPHSEHPYEWTSALTVGPDDFLYFVLTTDSWNAGASPDPELMRGAIIKMSWDGSVIQRYATGVRSVHSMVMLNQQLIFNDNEGGGNPTEELNLVSEGAFYGHNPSKYNNPMLTMEPIYSLQTEVAPSGMALNPIGNNFGDTGGNLFVAFYGPGGRLNRGAISRLQFTLAEGGMIEKVEEHPVVSNFPKLSDLTFSKNGDLYITQVGNTDYWYEPINEAEGAIYRMSFADWVKPVTYSKESKTMFENSETIELGKQLFAIRACDACHSVDGRTELLGPNLKDVGRTFSKEELLEEIETPSARIKPSMMGVKITKKSGEILLGRVISSNAESIDLMIVSNRVLKIARLDILKEENYEQSLMYSGLLTGLTEEEVNSILAYLQSLHLKNE